MRRLLLWMLGLAVAASGVWAGPASAAPNTVTISGSFLPKKLPKNERAPIGLLTRVEATNAGNPLSLPNPTALAKIDYDKDGVFQQKGLTTCDEDEFDTSTTPQEARDECADSLVGKGTATVVLPTGTAAPPVTVNSVNTVFNGPNKTLIFHTHNSLSGASTLVAKVGPADKAAGPQYGITVTLPFPAYGGGTGAITEFETRTKRIYRFRGKKRSLSSARCRGDQKLRGQARITDHQGQLATDTFVQSCKTKKN